MKSDIPIKQILQVRPEDCISCDFPALTDNKIADMPTDIVPKSESRIMNTTNCGICKLLERYANGAEDVKIVYESKFFLAVHSTKPFAEVHVFIAAKPHIETIFDINEKDDELVIDMMRAIKAASVEVISLKGACKLEMYLGEFQNTKHLHCYVIYDSSIE